MNNEEEIMKLKEEKEIIKEEKEILLDICKKEVHKNLRMSRMFKIYPILAFIGFVICMVGIFTNIEYLKGLGLGFNICSAVCSVIQYKLKWGKKL